MKNTDREFLKTLQNKISEEPVSLPEKLSPDSISELVEGEALNKKSRKTVKRISAAAACAVILFAAAAVGLRFYGPQIKPVSPSEESGPQADTDDYAEIREFFHSVREKSKSNSFFDEYNTAETSGAADDSADGVSQAENRAISQTDAQTQGVQEADIIKNDGRYLYIVHRANPNKIVIVDAINPNRLKTAAKISLPETDDEFYSAREIFLYDGKLIALTDTSPKSDSVYPDIYGNNGAYAVYGNTGGTVNRCGALIYDISDVTKPKKTAEYMLDGRYIGSRLAEGTLLITSNYTVPLYKDDKKLDSACIPSGYINGIQYQIPEKQIHILPDNRENSYSVIMKIDLKNGGAQPQTCAVLGGSSDLYCSKTDIYLAKRSYEEKEGESKSFTQIFRFSFENGLEYKSEVKLPGEFLNQFSMDEYNGFFRIATCERNLQSYVTVLDKSLSVIGSLGGIAKGESVYAARFIGDKAYIVTFYQTDPLFVIDLSNPSSPKIEGELKIPGFSNMLYPYSDTLLIGVGTDGNESGTNGKLKISLFDISDKSNPKEISKAVSGTSAYSIASYEHKAYMKFGDTGDFAIPILSYGASSESEEEPFICAFRVDNGGISVLKKYKADSSENGMFIRGAYTGGTVFAINTNELYAFDRETGEKIDKITLLDSSELPGGNVVVFN